MNQASNTLGRIRLEKVETGKGTRLEVRSTTSSESVRIDPLGLESLSWQDIESEVSSDNADVQASDAGITAYSFGEPVSLPHDMQLRNEYALVDVSIEDRSVEITAPKLGYSIQLTLRELEWLAHQDQNIFSTFLEHPFGPDT